MKKLKTIKSIKEDNLNNLLTACAILEHRPNLIIRARKEYKKHEGLYGKYVHNYYNKGFAEGYQYAIERLKKHNK